MGEYAKQVDESPRSLLDSCRNKMLRQAELWRVLGRRLTERLQRAKWIEPVHVNGRILYAEREIHLALKRVQREGYLLSSRVRNGSLSVRPKVRKSSLEEVLGSIPVDGFIGRDEGMKRIEFLGIAQLTGQHDFADLFFNTHDSTVSWLIHWRFLTSDPLGSQKMLSRIGVFDKGVRYAAITLFRPLPLLPKPEEYIQKSGRDRSRESQLITRENSLVPGFLL